MLVNGKTVFTEFNSFGQVSTTIPLNLWMKSGKNRFGIEVLPENEGEKINPKAYIKLELQVREHNDSRASYQICSFDFNANGIESGQAMENSTASGHYSSVNAFEQHDNGDVYISEIAEIELRDYDGAKRYERVVDISSSLPLWAFFTSQDLPDYENMGDDEYFSAIDNLFVEYKKVQDALLAGDVDTVISVAGERNTETDLAFYLESGTTEKRLRTSLEQALRDDNLELADLLADYLSIRVEDNRKLVRLVRGGDTTAIGFDFKSFPGSESYDFIFRRENGKWIVTR